MRNDEWFAGGVEEALVLDSIVSDPLRSRPIKRHGKFVPEAAKCGTMCHRRKNHIHLMQEYEARGALYSGTMARDVRRAIDDLANMYHGYRVLECYANGDFVGVGLCHKRGRFVLWRSFDPISRTFGDESVVPNRSRGLTYDDVIRLSGYDSDDPVRIVGQ